MSIPYKIKVKGKGNDVNIIVRPQPIATKEEYVKYIGKTIENEIIKAKVNTKNTFATRQELKYKITQLLTYFHEQGMIKPKEGD